MVDLLIRTASENHHRSRDQNGPWDRNTRDLSRQRSLVSVSG